MNIEFVDEVAGVYFRSVLLQRGEVATQHVHDYDHATLVGSGSAELWVGDTSAGYYKAGEVVKITAKTKHAFLALENDTRLICIHIAESAERAKAVALLEVA